MSFVLYLYLKTLVDVCVIDRYTRTVGTLVLSCCIRAALPQQRVRERERREEARGGEVTAVERTAGTLLSCKKTGN